MAVTPDTLHPAAQRLYAQVAHLEVADPERDYDPEVEGWPWATLCAALAKPIEPLYDVLMGGARPWDVLFDIDDDRARFGLPYVGNYAGVRFPPSVPVDRYALRLARARARAVGTADAIRAEVQQFLPDPAATVTLVLRMGGDAYRMRIVTYTTQTTAAAEAAIRARLASGEVVPAGLIWDYVVLAGQTYLTAEGDFATYAGAEAAYPSYADAASVIP